MKIRIQQHGYVQGWYENTEAVMSRCYACNQLQDDSSEAASVPDMERRSVVLNNDDKEHKSLYFNKFSPKQGENSAFHEPCWICSSLLYRICQQKSAFILTQTMGTKVGRFHKPWSYWTYTLNFKVSRPFSNGIAIHYTGSSVFLLWTTSLARNSSIGKRSPRLTWLRVSFYFWSRFPLEIRLEFELVLEFVRPAII